MDKENKKEKLSISDKVVVEIKEDIPQPPKKKKVIKDNFNKLSVSQVKHFISGASPVRVFEKLKFELSDEAKEEFSDKEIIAIINMLSKAVKSKGQLKLSSNLEELSGKALYLNGLNKKKIKKYVIFTI